MGAVEQERDAWSVGLEVANDEIIGAYPFSFTRMVYTLPGHISWGFMAVFGADIRVA